MEKIYPTVERILRSAKITDFEVYHERQVTRSYQVKDGVLEAAKEAVEVGVALRVFSEGRFSFGYSTDLNPQSLEDLAVAALHLLPFMEPDEAFHLPDSVPLPPTPDLKNFDFELEAIPAAKKIEAALAMEQAARVQDQRIRRVRAASYEEETVTVQIKNSRGLAATHSHTLCSIGVMAVAEAGAEAESGFEFGFSPHFSQLQFESVGRAAAKRAVSYLGAITPSTRQVPVVLDPLVAAEILAVLASSFQGDEVCKERSWLKGKLGQKVYSERLNIFDDALLPEGSASCPFDGEGQPRRRLNLVEGGVLKNFLLDRYFAAKLGMVGNGSLGRKGIQKLPAIHHSNLWIEPGTASDEEIFREVGDGIFVTEVIGMHMANAITGEFSVGAQGFLIESGEVTRPFKQVAIAGNLHQMMAQVRIAGSRQRFYYDKGAPTLAVEQMTVGGA